MEQEEDVAQSVQPGDVHLQRCQFRMVIERQDRRLHQLPFHITERLVVLRCPEPGVTRAQQIAEWLCCHGDVWEEWVEIILLHGGTNADR